MIPYSPIGTVIDHDFFFFHERRICFEAQVLDCTEFEDPDGNDGLRCVEDVDGHRFEYEITSSRRGCLLKFTGPDGEEHVISTMNHEDSSVVHPPEEKGFRYIRKRRWKFPENTIGVAKEFARGYYLFLLEKYNDKETNQAEVINC